jgi:Asp-tRNA(Asn)/Glu-tRNA(Gln) amidotransferase A subunit family amidase
MVRKMAVAATVICGLLVSPTVGPFTTQARADDLLTALYVLRLMEISDRYQRWVDFNANIQNPQGVAANLRAWAWELRRLPTVGVNPDVVRTVQTFARVLDSAGAAVVELDNPFIPDEQKALRMLDLLSGLYQLEQDMRRLQRSYR